MTRSRGGGFGAGYVYGIAGGIRDGAGQGAVGSEHECRPQSLGASASGDGTGAC